MVSLRNLLSFAVLALALARSGLAALEQRDTDGFPP
jgi:hypothetical protein